MDWPNLDYKAKTYLKTRQTNFEQKCENTHIVRDRKNYNLNLPFGQASLNFNLPGQDFMNCYLSLVPEQLVHILAHQASEWGKSLVRHKNLLVPDEQTAPAGNVTSACVSCTLSSCSRPPYCRVVIIS